MLADCAPHGEVLLRPGGEVINVNCRILSAERVCRRNNSLVVGMCCADTCCCLEELFCSYVLEIHNDAYVFCFCRFSVSQCLLFMWKCFERFGTQTTWNLFCPLLFIRVNENKKTLVVVIQDVSSCRNKQF